MLLPGDQCNNSGRNRIDGDICSERQFRFTAEAKALLEKVVISMKADPAKTVSQINKGEGGFRDRDLYPNCAGPDGKNIAHPDPARIGLVQRDIKDVTDKPYGAEFASAVEDKITEITYMYPPRRRQDTGCESRPSYQGGWLHMRRRILQIDCSWRRLLFRGTIMSASGRYCCKSRKSSDPKNLAKVDL